MILAYLLVVFGVFSLWMSINLQIRQNSEKEALIGVFYNQTNSEELENSTNPTDPQDNSPTITGDTIGILRIPSIDLVAPIGYGVDTEVINKQVGMYKTTDPFLTVGGNTGLAAHTSFRGGCSYCYFYHLRDVEMGEAFSIDYKDHKTYTFVVIDILNDEPIDADVPYKYKKEGESLITLSTCSDLGKKRDFVVAKLVKTSNSND